jgi:hypothetical protein
MQHDDMGTGVSTALERYRLIDVALLADFLASHLVCEKRHGRISLTEVADQRKGLATKLVIKCRKCSHQESTCIHEYNSPKYTGSWVRWHGSICLRVF